MLQVLVLDMHNLGDGRVMRQVNYVSQFYPTVRVNCSFERREDSETILDNNVSCFCGSFSPSSGTKIGKILKYSMSSLISNDITQYVKTHLNLNVDTIIHVHDPLMLPVAVRLQHSFVSAKIVYDRHEFFDRYKRQSKLPLPTPHTIEKALKNQISGLVAVVYNHEPYLKKLFPKAEITVVPNYMDYDSISDDLTQSKISSISDGGMIRCIYFGTLNNISRETDLIIYLAQNILSKYPNVEFVIGGKTNDTMLLDAFDSLSQQYGKRFQYKGFIPYNELIRETQLATIGFYFQRHQGTYWVASSPNKFYEYLKCGVIPMVRSPVDCSFMKPEGVICDFSESWESILERMEALINEKPEDLVVRMENLHNKSKQYSFASVREEYLNLYSSLFPNAFEKKSMEDFS